MFNGVSTAVHTPSAQYNTESFPGLNINAKVLVFQSFFVYISYSTI